MRSRRHIAAALAGTMLAACAVGVGDIRVQGGEDLVCTQERAPALQLRGRLDDEPDAERVALTYAVIVDDLESQFPGLLPIAVPVTDPVGGTVEYTDERTRAALCQQVAFDTFSEDGERSFVVRMLRERDQDVLAEGRFSIMMVP